PFPVERQRDLGLEVMQLLGFDFDAGRLDVSNHPFCGGVPEDVRITTRYREDDFVQSLMGIIHETGHARYEQGLPRDLVEQPVGRARSMGIHESQSLSFEMQLGRSRGFL
ncbi:carboxypeptidase M32, partial [Chromobacterium piscinae]